MPSQFSRYSKHAIASAIGVALALPVSAQELVLEEIIVTAQKREESLQDISATVNVVSGQAIDENAAFTFADLEQQTSGLSLITQNARSSRVSLRGITNSPEAGSESGVDIYFNDVLIRPDEAFSQMFDLERVEVLRGPQGALQGRTSPGGAIIINTRKPSLEKVEGYAQTSFSDNDGFNGQLAVSVPLIKDVLGIRVAGVYDENNANDVTNLVTGLETSDLGRAGRVTISFEPGDVFSAHLMHQYYERHTDDAKILQGNDALGVRPSLVASDRSSLSDTDDFTMLRYNITTLEMTTRAWNHDFTLLGGYRTSKKFSRQENDRAGYQTPGLDTSQNSETVLDANSVEFRISSVESDTWDYMLGFYYLDQDTTSGFSVASVAGPGINFTTVGAIPVNSENLAVFAFNKFYLSDSWTLDVGARWQKRNAFRAADVNFGELLFLPASLQPIRDVVVAGFQGNFPLAGVQPEEQYDSGSNVTGLIALRHDFNDDVSTYMSLTQSNRAGGVSISPGPNIASIGQTGMLLYDEEDSTAFEVGFKSRLLGGRASLNGAAFYQQFDGYIAHQTGLQIDESALDPAGALSNVAGGLVYNGDATVYGVEFDGQLLVNKNLSLSGNMSYAQAEYDDGAQVPCNDRAPGEAIGLCDIGGTAISSEPEFAFSLNGEFHVPMAGNEWYIRGLLKYNGERKNQTGSAGAGAVVNEFDAYTNINLYTGMRANDGDWDVYLWVKNLTDDDTITIQEGADATDIAASMAVTGNDFGSYTRVLPVKERTVGLTARYNFGF